MTNPYPRDCGYQNNQPSAGTLVAKTRTWWEQDLLVDSHNVLLEYLLECAGSVISRVVTTGFMNLLDRPHRPSNSFGPRISAGRVDSKAVDRGTMLQRVPPRRQSR